MPKSTSLDFGVICRKLIVKAIREDSQGENRSTVECQVRNMPSEEYTIKDSTCNGWITNSTGRMDRKGQGRKELQLVKCQQSPFT